MLYDYNLLFIYNRPKATKYSTILFQLWDFLKQNIVVVLRKKLI